MIKPPSPTLKVLHSFHLFSQLQLYDVPAAARMTLPELAHKREPPKYLTEVTEIGIFAVKS